MQHSCIHELFEAQAAANPQQTALIYADRSWSYAELNAQANRLAHQLRTLGIGPDTLVGVCLERTETLLIALLGILKAGGAYVPIDPDYPAERIAFMIEDSATQLVLTEERFRGLLEPAGAQLLMLTARGDELAEFPPHNLQPVAASGSLSYVIYTSGSTGKPKGVMLEHASVVHFIEAMQAALPVADAQKFLCVTTISFDIFVLETWLPLACGKTVVLASRMEQTDMTALSHLLQRSRIDLVQMTPSRMQLLVGEDPGLASLAAVRTLLLGGEPLPSRLLKTLQDLDDTKLFNMYGPTETTVWSLVQEVTHADTVTIGYPIGDTRIYIVGEDGALASGAGAIGELCIAGSGLARGYWNRPELTAERFPADPFAAGSGERMYRTGDLAHYAPDGSVVYAGRNDFQVKVRGFRIELGEIEAALESHPSVGQAVALVREEASGATRLAAYILPVAGASPAPGAGELRLYLQNRLPEYMVPSAFVEMESWPLTPNGKIDRRSLPNPSLTRMSIELPYTAPASEIEREIAVVWADILGFDRVGAEDDFIELGGNSLLSTQVLSRLQQLYGIRVSFRDMLTRGQTVAALAGLVEDALLLQAGDDELTALLLELDELSDEEAEALLAGNKRG
ncbi:non-ribosomal peptide synthetase [Paenibacillus athensensis]|nr:non-ribosomal peptide synthetase [Paenibacillus athensensis]MCD1258914.1 non-ribosomal peptide synthetase [Paenibacillus athensensis]